MNKKRHHLLTLLFLVTILSPSLLRAGDKKAVTAVGQSAFVIRDDGSLWAFGDNKNGRLGDGSTTFRGTPVKIMDNVVQVSAGLYHTLALCGDGSLWGWGDNDRCQLGDGSRTSRLVPVRIMDGVRRIYTPGAYYSAAVRTDGSLWMWGNHNPSEYTDEFKSITPVKVMGDVRSVIGDKGIFYAVDGSGNKWGWGELDGYGADIADMRQISNTLHSRLTLDNNGTLWSRSVDSRGKCATERVRVMDNVREISAGTYHTLIIRNDGSLWAMGENQFGQLGDGSKTNRIRPVMVVSGVRSASAGSTFSMWITSSGELMVVGAFKFTD